MCECGVELRPLHHGWGWAGNTSGTARHGVGSDRLGSSCAPPAPGLSCLFPGSSLLRHLPGLCLPAPFPMSVLLLTLLLSSRTTLPIWCFLRCKDAPSGGGRYVRIVDCFVCFVPHVSPSPWLLIWCQECLVVFPNYPVFKSSSLSVSVCQVYFVMCVSPAGSCMYYPGFDYIKSCWTLFLASSLLPAQSVTQGVHRVDNICNNQLNLIGVSHFVPQTH